MKRTITFLTLAGALLLALGAFTGAVAQADGDTKMPLPPPAKEMAKLDPLLGHWSGKGVAIMTDGGEEMPWTSTSTVKKILGGHFLEETVLIEMGMPVPMMFRTVYAWDHERKCYTAFGCGNMGSAGKSDMFWSPDGKMVQSKISMEGEDVVTERWVTEIDDDELSFVGYRAVNGGASFVHVKGTMKRKDKQTTLPAGSAKMAMSPASEELTPCHEMAGTWNYEGWVIPMPGAPKMEIEGIETVETILGGHTVMSVVDDKPTGYKAMSYMYWDDRSKTIKVFGVNNMGEVHDGSAYFSDGEMLMGHAGKMRGQFMVGENRMTIGEDKIDMVGRIIVDGKLIESMKMTMTRAKS